MPEVCVNGLWLICRLSVRLRIVCRKGSFRRPIARAAFSRMLQSETVVAKSLRINAEQCGRNGTARSRHRTRAGRVSVVNMRLPAALPGARRGPGAARMGRPWFWGGIEAIPRDMLAIRRIGVQADATLLNPHERGDSSLTRLPSGRPTTVSTPGRPFTRRSPAPGNAARTPRRSRGTGGTCRP